MALVGIVNRGVIATVLLAGASLAAELTPATVRAWNDHVHEAQRHITNRLEPGGRFLWASESADRLNTLRSGRVVVEPMGEEKPTPAGDGLIHHWIGAVYIPGATAQDINGLLDDFAHYREFYPPTVVRSEMLQAEDGEQRFSMTWVKKVAMVSTALDADYESRTYVLSPSRWYSLSWSTRVQEVRHFGRPQQTLVPEGEGAGYVWKLYSIIRAEQWERGVIVEMEAMVLSREIPRALEWVVSPIVRRTSREGLATTLGQTRSGIYESPRAAATPI